MIPVLTGLEVNFIVGVVCLFVGMSPIGTKITDWIKGIPADLRAALNGVEKTVVSNVKVAQANVIATLPVPAVKPVVVASAAPAPAAPAAPGA